MHKAAQRLSDNKNGAMGAVSHSWFDIAIPLCLITTGSAATSRIPLPVPTTYWPDACAPP
jgi:hypothetical protein